MILTIGGMGGIGGGIGGVLMPWRAVNDSYTPEELAKLIRNAVLMPWRAVNDSYRRTLKIE
jgi:hypothetical protein